MEGTARLTGLVVVTKDIVIQQKAIIAARRSLHNFLIHIYTFKL
jgi:hypothetical protein